MPLGGVEPLLDLLARSGRLPDASGLPSLLEALAREGAAHGLPAPVLRSAVRASLQTADPRLALNRLARLLGGGPGPAFTSLLEDSDGLRSLMAVLGYSGFLSSLIMRSPDDYVWLIRKAGLSASRGAAAMQDDLSASLASAAGPEGARQALRRNKYREMLRIGVRDLLGKADLETTVSDISALAEASIEAAVAAATAALRERHGVPVQTSPDGVSRPSKFAVLGLGKLGGGELNYSSDVDLYYLYSAHQGATTGRSSASGGYRDSVENHRFFVRLGEAVTGLLNDRTADGIVFRVDLRLRPEGESGELAYSLPSLEVYYQAWGRTTDRLALLKARPVGGDRRLGEEFLDLMIPFVYRRHLDYAALEDVGLLKEKIDRHAAARGGGTRDVKLGRGGIREIEFLVQSLQLIHGGRNPSLRERGTLRAIERLMRNGFLSERDAAGLDAAYRFLRDVEHKLQLVEERQTQSLPKAREDLDRLAFVLGFRRDGAPEAEAFEARLDKVMGEVRERFDRLFHVDRGVAPGAATEATELLREGLTAEEAQSALQAAGFTDPSTAWKNLLLLRDGPPYAHFPDACRRLLRQIAPRLLAEARATPEPDAVLLNLVRFIGRVGARASYYSMLAENPESIRLLARLFGSSAFLSALLVRQPDLLDVMVGGTDLGAARPREDLAEEVRGLLASSPSVEDELTALRRWRNGEILRVGLGDLLGLKDLAGVNAELTDLADVLLEAVVRLAVRDAAASADGRLAVVAMGKMGGREMNYSSDLDLVFVFEGGEGARAAFTRSAQRVITLLTSPTGEGILYRVDMRLRPSGHAGPLVTTLDAFVRYHREGAMVWERQALTKARCAAGPEDLRRRVQDAIGDLAYGRSLEAGALAEIRRVRARMEEEIAAEASGAHYDIKAGRGGLVDVEFAVQALQLTHGHRLPALRTPSTRQALSALAETGLVSENHYNTLLSAYTFYREIENRLQIYQDRSDPRVSREEDRAQVLARRLGLAGEGQGGAEFLERIRATREAVRAAFEEILAGVQAGLDGPTA